MDSAGRVKIISIELSDGELQRIEELANYSAVWVLVRLHYYPLGLLKIPLTKTFIEPGELRQLILAELQNPLLEHLLIDNQAVGLGSVGDLLAGLNAPPEKCQYRLENNYQPFATVAICTRNRAESLARVLNSIAKLDYPNFEVIVIDNAPGDSQTADLLKTNFPNFRYVLEELPGLDNARNRAISEAGGEILAFTDDDTVADPYWLQALVAAFETPDVMCVTGLVVPYELEHPAQQLFEKYGGFTRGFRRRTFHFNQRYPRTFYFYGAGEFGTGANMAFRRGLFGLIGNFDPALDVGTVTNGGGDLDIFFRVLMEKHTLVYEPAALIWHVHRADSERLQYQINGWGTGHAAFLTAALLRYPRNARIALTFSQKWFRHWPLAQYLKQRKQPEAGILPLARAETIGALLGPLKYFQARREQKRRNFLAKKQAK